MPNVIECLNCGRIKEYPPIGSVNTLHLFVETCEYCNSSRKKSIPKILLLVCELLGFEIIGVT